LPLAVFAVIEDLVDAAWQRLAGFGVDGVDNLAAGPFLLTAGTLSCGMGRFLSVWSDVAAGWAAGTISPEGSPARLPFGIC